MLMEKRDRNRIFSKKEEVERSSFFRNIGKQKIGLVLVMLLVVIIVSGVSDVNESSEITEGKIVVEWIEEVVENESNSNVEDLDLIKEEIIGDVIEEENLLEKDSPKIEEENLLEKDSPKIEEEVVDDLVEENEKDNSLTEEEVEEIVESEMEGITGNVINEDIIEQPLEEIIEDVVEEKEIEIIEEVIENEITDEDVIEEIKEPTKVMKKKDFGVLESDGIIREDGNAFTPSEYFKLINKNYIVNEMDIKFKRIGNNKYKIYYDFVDEDFKKCKKNENDCNLAYDKLKDKKKNKGQFKKDMKDLSENGLVGSGKFNINKYDNGTLDLEIGDGVKSDKLNLGFENSEFEFGDSEVILGVLPEVIVNNPGNRIFKQPFQIINNKNYEQELNLSKLNSEFPNGVSLLRVVYDEAYSDNINVSQYDENGSENGSYWELRNGIRYDKDVPLNYTLKVDEVLNLSIHFIVDKKWANKDVVWNQTFELNDNIYNLYYPIASFNSTGFGNGTFENTEVNSSNYLTLVKGLVVDNSSSGLVALYRFDNSSNENSTFFYDSADRHRNNGTCDLASSDCPDYGSGKFGTGMVFDGVDDFVDVIDKDILSFVNGSGDASFSISTWFYDIQDADGTFVAKATAAGTGEYYFLEDNQNLVLRLVDDSAGAWMGVRTDSAYSLNTWNYIVGTYDGSANTVGMKIYLNGVEQSVSNSSSGSYTGMENKSTELYVGKRGSATNLFWNGTIDEVAIYNKTLTASEIRNLYQNFTRQGNYSSTIINSTQETTNWTNISWSDSWLWNSSDPEINSSDLGLLALYHFNNDVIDYATGKNNLTITGANCNSNGRFDKGCFFDGINDRLSHSTLLDTVPSAMTFSAWIHHDGLPQGNVFSKSNVNSEDRIRLVALTSGKLLVFGEANNEGNFPLIISTTNVTGSWHHAAFTWDSVNGINLYVDGVLEDNNATLTTLMRNGTHSDFFVGMEYGVKEFWNGTIDEVGLWNRTLSVNEIQQLYRDGVGRIRAQFRSCDDAVCDGETFTGPDGTADTFYTNNFSSIRGGETLQYGQFKLFYNLTYLDVFSNKTPFIQNAFVSYGDSIDLNLINPVSSFNTSGITAINFTYNVSVSGTADNCSFFLTDLDSNTLKLNQTDTVIEENANQTFNVTGLKEGNYSWLINCVENQGFTSNSSRTLFSIDNQIPNVSIGKPVNWFNSSSVTIEMNISVSDRNVKNVTVRGNWSGEVSNTSSGLVGLWHLNNNSAVGENSTFFYDEADRHRNNGTCDLSASDCPLFNTSGKFSGGYTFDGVDDYVNVGDDNSLDLTMANTIQAWVNIPSDINLNTEYGLFIAKRGASGANYQAYITGTEMRYYNGATVITSTVNVPKNSWQHVAFVHNSSDILFYLNGVMEESQNLVLGSAVNGNLSIGWDAGSAYSKGSVDEVAIWNRTLNADEIYTLYASKVIHYNTSKISDDYNVTVDVGDGDNIYSWNVTVCDFASNCNTSVWNFTVDTLVPNVSIGRLDNGTYLKTRNTEFNFSVADRNVKNVTFYGNFSNEVDNESSGLVAYWKFNNGSNSNKTHVYDWADRHRNNGSLDSKWVSGNISNGLSFDGSDDYVDVGDKTVFEFTGDFSVSAWVKSTNFLTYGRILEKSSTSPYWYNDGGTGYAFDVEAGIVKIGINDGTGDDVIVSADTNISDGNWHHIVGVWDRDGNGLVYIDGLLNGSGDISGESGALSNNGNLRIGKSQVGNANDFLNGSIDEVMIFNRSLSSTEILDLWKNQTNGSRTLDTDSSLVSYWKLDEDKRNKASDSKGSNDGTLIGYVSPDYETGKFLSGMSFDGIDDFVNVSDDNSLDILGNITISSWVKLANENDEMTFVNKWSALGNAGYIFSIGDSGCGNNQLSFLDGGPSWICSNTATIQDNTWHFVVVAVNDSNTTYYFDGTELGVSGSSDSALNGTNTRSLEIGYRSATANLVNGTIDDLAIYNKTLTADEIFLLYKTSRYYNTSGVSDDYNVTFDTFVDGKHKWNVSVCDFAGNCNSTGYRYFVSDTVLPSLSWVSPTPNNNSFVDIDSVYLNTSVSDNSNTSAWFDWNNSLVAYYSFDEYNSSGVYDNSSYSNFGVIGGTTDCSIFGKYGKGCKFSATGDEIAIENNFTDLVEFTISTWVKPAGKHPNLGGIINSGDWRTVNHWLLTLTQTNEGIGFRTNSTGGVQTISYTFNIGQWYNVVAMRNSSATVNFYVNGISIGNKTKNAVAGNLVSDDLTTKIGTAEYFNGYWFNGTIDEVKIWDRALTADEINASYNNNLYRLFNNFS
ncbi:hypothetical protein CL618_00005, partial [archaeon]|nr:hypothetical protein [archaeon]